MKKLGSLFEKQNKSAMVLSLIFGFLLSTSLILGYQLQNKGMTSAGLRRLTSIGLALLIDVIIGPICYFLMAMANKAKGVVPAQIAMRKQAVLFLIFGAVTFISWLPAFLAYYPCVMSSDFDIQLYQVKQGHEFFTNHHPYLSTLEIEFFYNLAPVLGTVRKAMAAFGLWHLFVMASAFAILDLTIYKLSGKLWIAIVCGILFILYPVNPVLGLSTTKDVVFSSAFLWFMCLVTDKFFIRKSTKLFEISDIAIWFFGLLMCSYRNNAVYALAVTGIVMVICAKGRKKLWYVAALAAILISHKATQTGIERYLGVESSAVTPEMHSIIIQTFGRAYVNNTDTLSLEDKEIIEYYIPKDSLKEYNPALSDPLKTPVTNKTFDAHWKGNMVNVFKDWIKVGLHYPDDYFDAILDLTRGYWYLYDTSYATVWGADLKYRMGLLYTNNTSGYYGMDEIWHESKLPGLEQVYEKILSRNDFFKWPILNMFFRLSFYTIAMIFVGLVLIQKKEHKKLCFLILPALYFGTLLLGPTAYIRYMFPIMISTPIFVTLLFTKSEQAVFNEQEN